jgi:hypothetical protein
MYQFKLIVFFFCSHINLQCCFLLTAQFHLRHCILWEDFHILHANLTLIQMAVKKEVAV